MIGAFGVGGRGIEREVEHLEVCCLGAADIVFFMIEENGK